MVRKILEEKPIPLGQVHELLKIREETGINYVQRVTAQHAEKLSRDAAYSEEVLEALQEEFELPRILVVQIVNINPLTPVDVRAVLGDRLSSEKIEQLLTRYSELVAEFKPVTKTDELEEDETGEEEEGFDDL
jgi:DNA-directed RNA polymerase subunit F